MSKFSKIPSEIRSFFSEKRREAVHETYCRLVEGLKIRSNELGGVKRENCQLTNLQIFQLLLLMPFFAIPGFSHYGCSALNKMFGGQKDVFYDFVRQDTINWRNILYRLTGEMIRKVTVRKDYRKSGLPSVLIADDSDLPKTGMRMEGIGKVFDHVHGVFRLGYKALVMIWSDGRSQFVTDFSLHGEKGKVEGKEQGLTARQRAARHNRQRDVKSHGHARMDELFASKLERVKEMVKRTIKARIPFDYLLVDSWFTCLGLVDFVCRTHKKFHLLGMGKFSNTKYRTSEYGDVTAKALLSKLEKSKKYSRMYRCHHITVNAKLGSRKVRLYFCRRTKSEGWRLLVTTNLKLDFMEAYRIYAMRWAIEVFFADAKRILGLADCSARDFTAQIAHVTIVALRYNLLASIKRSEDYETMGGLFNDIYAGVKELTVVERIWTIIIEVVALIAELTGADEETLMRQVLESDKRLNALRAYAEAS